MDDAQVWHAELQGEQIEFIGIWVPLQIGTQFPESMYKAGFKQVIQNVLFVHWKQGLLHN